MPNPGFWADQAEADAATTRVGSANVVPHFEATGSGAWAAALPSFFTARGNLFIGVAEIVIDWFAWQWPETELVYEERQSDGSYEVQDGHPCVELLDQPTPDVDGGELSGAYVTDILAGGRAQLHKLRNFQGGVIGLRWLPTLVTNPVLPMDRSPITAWQVRNGPTQGIPADDVVYLRYKLDPADQRLSIKPLDAIAQELLGDQEAARVTPALLRNSAFPGVIISPDWPSGAAGRDMEFEPISEATGDLIKSTYKANFGGENRGEPMVMTTPTRVSTVDPNLAGMDISEIRAFYETRACARFRMPPIVLSFKAGLDKSTFNNFDQAQRIAYVNALTPMQRKVARTFTNQLLPEFDPPPMARLRYDYSQNAGHAGKRKRARRPLAWAGSGRRREPRRSAGRARPRRYPRRPVSADSRGRRDSARRRSYEPA